MSDLQASQQQNQPSLHPILSSSSSSGTSRNVSPVPTPTPILPERQHPSLPSLPASAVDTETPTSSKKTSNNNSQPPRNSRSSTIESGTKSPIRKGHLRTLSITSSPSSNSPVTSNKKAGINLGLNVFGGPPPVMAQSTAANLSTPVLDPKRDRDLSNTRATLLSPPPLNDKISSLNTVFTPELKSPRTPTKPSLEPNQFVDKNRSSNDLSKKLRLLASKEMEILNLKQQIKDLTDKKRDMEFELQDLKVSVEKQLVEQISRQTQNESTVGRFDKHTPRSPISIQKNKVRAIGSAIDPLLDDGYSPTESPLQDNQTNPSDRGKSSWFSKPLNFIQQFDNLIYQEIEKLHLPNLAEEEQEYSKNSHQNQHLQKTSTDDHGSESLIGDNTMASNSSESFDKIDPKDINRPIKRLAGEQSHASRTMQSVSNHIWSFVNEVKSNLMNEEDGISDTSSTTTTGDHHHSHLTPSPRKFRTPSLSNRQTYGQFGKGKRRTSSSAKKNEPFTNVTLSNDNETSTLMLNSVMADPEESQFKKTVEMKELGGDGNEEQFDEVTEADLWDNETYEL